MLKAIVFSPQYRNMIKYKWDIYKRKKGTGTGGIWPICTYAWKKMMSWAGQEKLKNDRARGRGYGQNEHKRTRMPLRHETFYRCQEEYSCRLHYYTTLSISRISEWSGTFSTRQKRKKALWWSDFFNIWHS